MNYSTKKSSFLLSLFTGFFIFFFAIPTLSAEQQIISLDQLLQKVKTQQQQERTLNRKREATFITDRNKQKTLLRKAEQKFLSAQKINNPIKKITDANQKKIDSLQKELDTNIEELGDIYSIFHEFSGDLGAALQNSMIQAEFPARSKQISLLSSREKLPTIDDMEQFWILVQEEMTESGKIAVFDSPVLSLDGHKQQQTVLRVGTFTAMSEGKFLRYIPQTKELLTLSRQPRQLRIAKNFEDAVKNKTFDQPTSMIIDPTRGALLGRLVQSPTLLEKIKQGKTVGYAIIIVGVVGLFLVFWRCLNLLKISRATQKQLASIGHPNTNNPLGRVINSVKGLGSVNEETLQFKLDEAILQEIPPLERGLSLIKLFAAIAPLMGLLGTVIGMIATFQAIALFGSGDPKLMASGISQALVTTVLGLVVAIPLLLGHNITASLSRSLIQILDEQSAGLLAKHLEQQIRSKKKLPSNTSTI